MIARLLSVSCLLALFAVAVRADGDSSLLEIVDDHIHAIMDHRAANSLNQKVGNMEIGTARNLIAYCKPPPPSVGTGVYPPPPVVSATSPSPPPPCPSPPPPCATASPPPPKPSITPCPSPPPPKPSITPCPSPPPPKSSITPCPSPPPPCVTASPPPPKPAITPSPCASPPPYCKPPHNHHHKASPPPRPTITPSPCPTPSPKPTITPSPCVSPPVVKPASPPKPTKPTRGPECGTTLVRVAVPVKKTSKYSKVKFTFRTKRVKAYCPVGKKCCPVPASWKKSWGPKCKPTVPKVSKCYSKCPNWYL